jgi:hypothetical protein
MSGFEEIEFGQLVLGLGEPSYVDYRETFLRVLCNRASEGVQPVSGPASEPIEGKEEASSASGEQAEVPGESVTASSSSSSAVTGTGAQPPPSPSDHTEAALPTSSSSSDQTAEGTTSTRSGYTMVSSISAEDVKDCFTVCLTFLKTLTAEPVLIDLTLALINNLTVAEENCLVFLSMIEIIKPGVKQQATPVGGRCPFRVAISRFMEHNPQLEEEGTSDWSTADPYQHIASILCNLARLQDGRELLLLRSSGYMPHIITQVRSEPAPVAPYNRANSHL